MLAISPWIATRLWVWAALGSNLLVTVFLVALTRSAAIYAQQKTTYDDVGTCGVCRHRPLSFPVSVSAENWNSMTLKLGLIVGVVTSAALTAHELLLRRESLAVAARGKRLGALIRPITYRWDSRTFCSRWIAFTIVIVASTTRAVVALLGASQDHDALGSGISFPLEALNETFLYANGALNDSALSPDPRKNGVLQKANPFIRYDHLYPNDTLEIPEAMKNTAWYLDTDQAGDLEAFMYRSTVIHTSKTVRNRPALVANITGPGARKGFPLGDAIFPSTSTEGMGINMSSYERFMGDGMAGLPRTYTFKFLMGEAYGNNVSVTCLNIRGEYKITAPESNTATHLDQPSSSGASPRRRWNQERMTISHLTGPQTYEIRRDSANAQMLVNFGFFHSSSMTTTRGSETSKEEGSFQAPSQTIIMPNWKGNRPNAIMAECIYMPSEYHKVFMVRGLGAPIVSKNAQMAPNPRKAFELAPLASSDLKCLSPILALPAARAIHELLLRSDQPTSNPLRKALQEMGYQPHAYQTLAPLLERVLGETAQAYFSLLRQRVEKANMWPHDAQLKYPQIKIKRMGFEIIKVGGTTLASVPWLVFVALLTMFTGIACLRACAVGGWISLSAKMMYEEPRIEAISETEKQGEHVDNK